VLADDVDRLGIPVVAGFCTHPHWDHLLWHHRFGDVPRYATPAAAQVAGAARERAQGGDRWSAARTTGAVHIVVAYFGTAKETVCYRFTLPQPLDTPGGIERVRLDHCPEDFQANRPARHAAPP
jgi:glyoxylase-like metal-dependent hydrolase (beta-lactamase superfamily II)